MIENYMARGWAFMKYFSMILISVKSPRKLQKQSISQLSTQFLRYSDDVRPNSLLQIVQIFVQERSLRPHHGMHLS